MITNEELVNEAERLGNVSARFLMERLCVWDNSLISGDLEDEITHNNIQVFQDMIFNS